MPELNIGNWRDRAATLNNVTRPCMLQNHEFQRMTNMKWDGGVIAKRGGTVEYGSATGAYKVMGMWIGYRADGTETPIRLRFENGLFEYNTGAGWTSTTLSGWSTSKWPTVLVYQNKFFMFNGTDAPKYIAFSALTTPTAITMPTDFNPSKGVVYMNKIWLWGDTSTPNRIHFSDFGDPLTYQEQNFYSFPDNQNGGSCVGGVAAPDGIILYGQDFFGMLTGASEEDNAIRCWPRRSATLSERAIIDMGGTGVNLTPEGPEIADGFSQPRSLDPGRAVNWGDANLTDPNDVWGVRTGPFTFRIYVRSRGATTSASSSTVSVGRLLANLYTRVRTVFSNTPAASAPTVTSHYYEYDMVANSWSGPHTGAHSCGTWETMMHGDRQFVWLGDAANGKTYKGDQDVFTDDGSPIECILRTGSFGLDPFKTYQVTNVKALVQTATTMIKMRVYVDEQPIAYAVEREASAARIGDYQSIESTSDDKNRDRGGYCMLEWDLTNENVIGRSPQIELLEKSDKPFVVIGLAITVEER